MDTVVVRQFLNFFQDFIDLCQWKDWPSADTTEDEIKNAYIISQHIEHCLDRFQNNNTLNNFLVTFNSIQDSNAFLKNCLIEPTKFILKKIIHSKVSIIQMDTAFKVFLQLFSEEKLENYLADLFVEASSKELLLKKMASEIDKEKILLFQSELLLSQITVEGEESLQNLINNFDQNIVNIIVVSLCSTQPRYQISVNVLSSCFLEFLLSKSIHFKKFWKMLFNVEDKYLINMCVENSDLYTYICEAIIDCGKLIKENMSMEFFHMEFTYSELVGITKRLFTNEFLKAQFVNILNDHDINVNIWQEVL